MMQNQNQLQLHGWAEDLKDVAMDFYDRAGRRVVQESVAPIIEEKVQRLAAQQIRSLIEMAVDAIPPKEELEKIADNISSKIINAIHENILPQMFSEVGRVIDVEVTKVGSTFEEMRSDPLYQAYNNVLQRVPILVKFNVGGVDLELNLKHIVAQGLTFDKFKKIYNSVQPMVQRIQTTVVPAAETKIKRVAGFSFMCGLFAGGLITFAFVRLYDSAK